MLLSRHRCVWLIGVLVHEAFHTRCQINKKPMRHFSTLEQFFDSKIGESSPPELLWSRLHNLYVRIALWPSMRMASANSS